MSRLRIFNDTDPATPLFASTDLPAIAAQLQQIGVRFEQWQAAMPVQPGATPDELMAVSLELAQQMADVELDLLVVYKALIDDGYELSFGAGLGLEHERSTAHNAAVTPEMVAARRAAVQARGRSFALARSADGPAQ